MPALYTLAILFLVPDDSSSTWRYRIRDIQQVEHLMREDCQRQRAEWLSHENVEVLCLPEKAQDMSAAAARKR